MLPKCCKKASRNEILLEFLLTTIMQSKTKNLTVSNIITISRLVALPFIVYFLFSDQRITAFVIMIISLLSDAIDGYVARKLNQISDLGKFLDPLCDKISLAVILITLLLIDAIPLWAIIIIIARDFLILLGSYFILKDKSLVLTSNVWGKITGFILGAVVLAFTLNLREPGMILIYLSIPAIIVSFVVYTYRYVKVMKGVQ
jgi:CDP-diacylglycerol--glycerol-3-phosphate 3-phosphatidyltransferase